MWRPDDWDAYYGAHSALMNNDPWLEDEHSACYEAGADAVLNALKPLIMRIAPSSKLADILYPTSELSEDKNYIISTDPASDQ